MIDARSGRHEHGRFLFVRMIRAVIRLELGRGAHVADAKPWLIFPTILAKVNGQKGLQGGEQYPSQAPERRVRCYKVMDTRSSHREFYERPAAEDERGLNMRPQLKDQKGP
ncbi:MULTISPECIES: hypothetical protein [unclassified Variovorax]|uniref:hypothetical protein n=1 Tax=unclassified Variovorax TaxID=663243 RepID=UPI003F483447